MGCNTRSLSPRSIPPDAASAEPLQISLKRRQKPVTCSPAHLVLQVQGENVDPLDDPRGEGLLQRPSVDPEEAGQRHRRQGSDVILQVPGWNQLLFPGKTFRSKAKLCSYAVHKPLISRQSVERFGPSKTKHCVAETFLAVAVTNPNEAGSPGKRDTEPPRPRRRAKAGHHGSRPRAWRPPAQGTPAHTCHPMPNAQRTPSVQCKMYAPQQRATTDLHQPTLCSMQHASCLTLTTTSHSASCKAACRPAQTVPLV